MKNLVRKSIVLFVLLISAGLGSAAHALPIFNGIFNLVNDGSSIPYAPGALIATGSFTTENSVTGTLAGFDIVPLVELFVIDRTPDSGFGNISYTASTASNYFTTPLYALLDQTNGDFIGLQGTIMDLLSNPMLSLTLNGANANIGGATFGFQNINSQNFESGFQIPEPSALALFGIALIAFGFVRRKASA